MDGIDVAMIETDGETVSATGPVSSRPYGRDERRLLLAAIDDAQIVSDRDERAPAMEAAERMVTEINGEAVERFLADNRLRHDQIDIVGFHGQTVIHRPERGFTVQLGDGIRLAERLGIDVVYDLRAADMAAGGQGAPLVPVFHRALAFAARLALPVVIVNIGGVANVTWIGEAEPVAFDTGPGNALIDDLVRARTGAPFDRDGRLAASGRVDGAALEQLLDHRYFAARPPKSLDRDAFTRDPVAGLSLPDAAATLTAFTARSIALAARHFPAPPCRWIVAGGGARNPSLMSAFSHCAGASVISACELGWSVDYLEAQAFAFLAVRALRGLPTTFPTTTGAKAPITGGVIARGGKRPDP